METVRILNTKQAGLYIKNNVNPIKLYWSKGSLVFEFNKEECQELYFKWLKRELN